MGNGSTTLAVPKEFAEMLRESFDGRNDLERLKSWASDLENESYKKDITDEETYNNSISLDDVDDVMREAIRDEVPDLLRRLK